MTINSQTEADNVSILDAVEAQENLFSENQSEEGRVVATFFRGSMSDGDELCK